MIMTKSTPISSSSSPSEWRWVYGAFVVLAATLWILSVAITRTPEGQLRFFFSPVIAYGLLIAVLRPFAGTAKHRTLVTSVSVLMVLWLFNTLGSILAPFIVAFVIAYILHPLADKLVKRGVPRLAAVALLTIPIIALIVLSLVFGIPALVSQMESLVKRLPEAVQKIATSLDHLRGRLLSSRIPFIDNDKVAAQLTVDQAKIAAFIQQQQQAIVSRIWHAVLGVGKGFSFLLSLIGYLVLTPVLIIYLLKDFNSMSERVHEMVPLDRRAKWRAFISEYDDLLSRFLRGQLIEAVLVGILTWLGLMLLGVPYAGLVGVVAGVFNLIPYLGLVVSILPVIVIAVLSGDFVSVIAKSGIVFFVVQLIDGTITGPRIVGGSIGIHPVVVILALAIGSTFFGFVGLLLAMPAAILIKLLVRDAIVRYKSSALYRGEALAAETE